MKIKCSLCGGTLKNGICTECGMNNRKSDDMYKRQVKSEVRQEPKQEQVRKVQARTKASKQLSYHQPLHMAYEKKNRSKITVILIGIIFILFIMSLISAIAENPNDDVAVDMENFDYEDDYDPYANITEELNAQGQSWEQSLGAGVYVVGIDIPEGEYRLTGPDGSGYEVRDKKRMLIDTQDFGTADYQIQAASGVKLFDGAIVKIEGKDAVHFTTENGQTEVMTERIENPIKEETEITGEAVAGVDFPAGTYDVWAIEDTLGILEYAWNPQDEAAVISVLMEEDPKEEFPNFCGEYKNAVFPEGCKIRTEDLKVKLVPSHGITTEDYLAFYENYY